MKRFLSSVLFGAVAVPFLSALLAAPAAVAQDSPAAGMASVMCTSRIGERQHCSADTSGRVLLARSTGEGACLLGKTWGYDDAGVWVTDGCGAEFEVRQAALRVTAAQALTPPVAEQPPTPAPTLGGEYEKR